MTTDSPLTGTFTALVTPFTGDGIDEARFSALVDRQFAAGVDGVAAVGTTGESPTVSYDEHYALIRLAVEAADGRGAVMAGTGSNSTSEAVEATVEAARLGATHALLVAPYYNKPSQEGLFRHFAAIAEAVEIPLVLYSIPGRCGIEIGVETMARLAEAYPHVVAIKEAGGRVDRVHQLVAALPDRVTVLCGDDALTLPFMASGAGGVVSVASNLCPEEVAAMVRHLAGGDLGAARSVHYRLYPLFRALLTLDVNPVPIKHAMARLGLLTEPRVRLPLAGLEAGKAAQLDAVLAACGLT